MSKLFEGGFFRQTTLYRERCDGYFTEERQVIRLGRRRFVVRCKMFEFLMEPFVSSLRLERASPLSAVLAAGTDVVLDVREHAGSSMLGRAKELASVTLWVRNLGHLMKRICRPLPQRAE